MPYTSSFKFTVTIKDAFGQSETRQITLPSTTPVVWIGKSQVKVNGKSVNTAIAQAEELMQWKQKVLAGETAVIIFESEE